MPKLFPFIAFFLAITSCRMTDDHSETPFDIQQKLIQESPYSSLQWRLIGPDNKSGRATDIWGVAGDTNIIYAAFATGGLWKTTDAGKSWKPLFDKEATLSIGTIAVAHNDANTVYVGTGEANIFRASLPGKGIYKTTDGGLTFRCIGLENVGTIARIIIHPKDTNTVYVAASGNEWSYNQERGLYKTTDGGKTWNKILFQDEKNGCIDIIMDPSDPNTIYASMWNRIRKRWSDPIPEDGDHLYKTTDGGKTWNIIDNGLPDTKLTGRIGLALATSNPNVLYAFVDDHNIKRQPNPDETDSYERKVQKVVIGGAIYRSNDKGEHWQKMAEIHDFFKPFSGTYGWVFSQIRVNPKNENDVYVMGVNMGRSQDGGKTWTKFEDPKQDIHGDNHGMWFDPINPNIILLANDGGVSRTYDGGASWKNFFNLIPTTQFYTITYDMASPFNVYGSVQDEGTLAGNSMITFGSRKDTTLQQWDYAPGGEGTQIRVHPHDNNIIYSSSFYGRLMKSDMRKKGDDRSNHFHNFDVGRIDSLRAEWLAATILSKFKPSTIYHGLQAVYKSDDEGKNWKKISPDLSYNDAAKKGVYPYLIYHQTITSLAEGHVPGVLYAGTDDGRVWLTEDDGANWKEITKGLPTNKHVMSIVASAHEKSTLYLVLNDRRSDNNESMIYASIDKGNTWSKISNNLPNAPANVVIEDLTNKNVLYCGTDMGPYISHDQGKSWQSITGNLPYAVSVNDMFIHPRDKKLVIGTYGRGVWVLDDISQLQSKK